MIYEVTPEITCGLFKMSSGVKLLCNLGGLNDYYSVCLSANCYSTSGYWTLQLSSISFVQPTPILLIDILILRQFAD